MATSAARQVQTTTVLQHHNLHTMQSKGRPTRATHLRPRRQLLANCYALHCPSQPCDYAVHPSSEESRQAKWSLTCRSTRLCVCLQHVGLMPSIGSAGGMQSDTKGRHARSCCYRVYRCCYHTAQVFWLVQHAPHPTPSTKTKWMPRGRGTRCAMGVLSVQSGECVFGCEWPHDLLRSIRQGIGGSQQGWNATVVHTTHGWG